MESNFAFYVLWRQSLLLKQTSSRVCHHITSTHHTLIIHVKILRDLFLLHDCKRRAQFFLLLLLSHSLSTTPCQCSLKHSEGTWPDKLYLDPKVVSLWCWKSSQFCLFAPSSASQWALLSLTVVTDCYSSSHHESHWAMPDDSDLQHGWYCSHRTKTEKEEFHHCALAIHKNNFLYCLQ